MEKEENKTFPTVAELLQALRAGEISSAEMTERYIGRTEACEESIHAYITRMDAQARQAAQEADARRLRGEEDTPLAGIPFAVKDNMAVPGVPMTCASKMLASFVPPYTASAVEKAGKICLGKTNLDEFAMGSSCEKSIAGATRNPLDLTRSAGGSSGGSAAAVASGMAPWALGTDTGGSSRQPAAFCGIVAMKPTYGRISRYGVTELASSMDTVSPMTRDVYDNALVLDVLAGRDDRDMTSLEAGESCTARIADGVRGLRIGLMQEVETLCEPVQAQAILRAASLLEKEGALVEPVRLPDPADVTNTYFITMAAECSSNFARYDGLKYGLCAEGADFRDIMTHTRREGFGEEVQRRMIAGAYILSSTISGDRYQRVQALRQTLCEQMDALFASCDVVLMPTTTGPAFSLGGFDVDPTALYTSDCFTALTNLTGHPALSLPCGGDGHLPCGAMLLGARGAEPTVYRAAYALEQALKPLLGKEAGTLAV